MEVDGKASASGQSFSRHHLRTLQFDLEYGPFSLETAKPVDLVNSGRVQVELTGWLHWPGQEIFGEEICFLHEAQISSGQRSEEGERCMGDTGEMKDEKILAVQDGARFGVDLMASAEQRQEAISFKVADVEDDMVNASGPVQSRGGGF